MIIGTVAAQQPATIGGGGIDYSGATVVMDFENSTYLVNGSATAIGDMIDRTTTVITGGLRIDWNADPTEYAIGLLSPVTNAIDFSVGWTVLLDFIHYDVEYGQKFLHFWNGTYAIPNRTQVEIQTESTYVYAYDMRRISPENTNRDVTYSVTGVEGARRKIGVTRATDRLAVSVDGAATQSTAGAATATPTYSEYSIGGYAADGYTYCNALFKKIIFYPPISDVLLPTYTA